MSELKYTIGLHCKACNAPLNGVGDMDTELCNTCMEVVFDYNRSLEEELEALAEAELEASMEQYDDGKLY